MTRTIAGCIAGVADTGARYRVVIRRTPDARFTAVAAHAGALGRWTETTLVDNTTWEDACRAATSRFHGKMSPGADRCYNRPMSGGDPAARIPRGLPYLPESPLIWSVGRNLTLLPADLHGEAILMASGNAAPDTLTTPPPAAPSMTLADLLDDSAPPRAAAPLSRGLFLDDVEFADDPDDRVGQTVMLCRTVESEDALRTLIDSDAWVVARKIEGERVQLHHLMRGEVVMTSRAGERIECPPALAAAMRQLPPATSLDGELVSLDDQGREQLYVGGAARLVRFVAFDLVRTPGLADIKLQGKLARMRRLARMIPAFALPLTNNGPALVMVPWAEGREAKVALHDAIQAQDGEGLVFYHADAHYVGARSDQWLRWRMRQRTVDAIVLGFRSGAGSLASVTGAIEVGLYAPDGTVVSVGWVGSGWTNADREFFQRCDNAGVAGFVVEVACMGLTFNDQLIRPSGVRVRAVRDKRPTECVFTDEFGRPPGAFREGARA